MRARIPVVAVAAALAASAALADMAPTPDRGPPEGEAGGLSFMIRSVAFQMGPANGPRYTKTRQAAVLAGCADGTPNCALAKSKTLIGMEVSAVDGMRLRPQKGMVRQILDAFADAKAPATITLTFYGPAANARPVEVAFARR